MKLFIDTSQREKTILKLDDEAFEKDSTDKKSQILLPFIVEVLKNKGKDFKDLTEIEVNTGPGSFTGLRVGVSVANALGWTLGVHVNGKDLKDGEVVEPVYS